MNYSVRLVLSMALMLGACGSADEVEVQPLPSLDRVSPEARAGVPEMVGDWSFAGWDLAPGDSAGLLSEDLPRFGVLSLDAQRRDSIGGSYRIAGSAAPLNGEVRRDGVVALVGVFGPGDLRFLTGRMERDTVWMELSSLVEQARWPRDARAAFVRTTVAEPFVRLRGAVPVAPIDTASLSADTLPPAAAGAAAITPPVTQPRPEPASPARPVPSAVTPPPSRPNPTPPVNRPPPQPSDSVPDEPVDPPIEPAQEPPPVPLLGEPAVQDTGGQF